MSKPLRYLLICITAGFLLLTVIKSLYYTKKYGGTDLRCRIVGARILGTEHSPYYYKWNPADGEFYLDPNDVAYKKINGNVVTPATLMMISPLSKLSYPTIRWIWTILQFIAAFIILIILFKRKNISETFLAASPIILGLICSDIWLYNVERGQMYIFYGLSFTVIYGLYISKWKHNEFLSGIAGGLFMLFRPLAAIIGLGFLLHGKKRWIAGCITGFIIGFLIFVLPHISAWQDYFTAMQEYVKESMGAGYINPHSVETIKPAIIEGADNIREYRVFDMYCLETLYSFCKRFGLIITTNQSFSVFIVVLTALSFFFFRLRKKNTPPDILFLFGFLTFILSEVLLPVPRGSYNIIYWIFPLSLIWLRSKTDLPLLAVLTTGLLLLHNFPFTFPRLGELAEFIFVLATIYVIFFKKDSREDEKTVST